MYQRCFLRRGTVPATEEEGCEEGKERGNVCGEEECGAELGGGEVVEDVEGCQA